MHTFDFYEFAGILAPGAVVLLGFGLIYPPAGVFLKDSALSIGDLGVFLILAYVAGHLVQGVGNLIESAWWWAWGGWPTDWVRTGRRILIPPTQALALQEGLQAHPVLSEFAQIKDLTEADWYAATRQVLAAVRSAGRAAQVDTFVGNYGLNRGIAAGLLLLVLLSVFTSGIALWRCQFLMLAGAGLALYRMHRFGKYYANEIFVQFLQIYAESSGERPMKEKAGTSRGGKYDV